MGYDIHITRQENWFDEDSNKKIPLEEWKDFLANDPEMRPGNVAEATTTSGKAMRIESDGLAVWTSYSGNGINGNFAWFDYNNGNIVCKNPDDEIIAKMLDIGKRLKAKIQGDEGELYESSVAKEATFKKLNTEENNRLTKEKPWWKFW